MPSNGPGSRRKSCQECARSKIKCDLQEPCTKCAERGRQCIYLNDPQVSLAKLQARRPSQSEATSPIQPSPASSSRSAGPPSPPNYDSSTSPYTSPESSPIPGHMGPAGNSYDAYDSLAWMADGTTTPLSSPGWTEMVPPTTPLTASLPTTPIDPFAAQFSAFAGPLPTHTDGSLLSPDELHEVMNCPFSGPCYHAGGACLCHTPLNPNELQALLSSTLAHAGQYSLPDGLTSQMAPMSYPMAPHGATYPMATGPEVDREFCVHSHAKSGSSSPQLPRLWNVVWNSASPAILSYCTSSFAVQRDSSPRLSGHVLNFDTLFH
jgi:hypothetical protein